MKTTFLSTIFLSAIIALFLSACVPQAEKTTPLAQVENQSKNPLPVEMVFTLQTLAKNGKLLYIGMGGDIDGIINPDLVAQPGAVVRIILINGDGMPHDLFLPDLDTKTPYVSKIGEQAEIVFEVGEMPPGSYIYYCTLPGHRKAGQEGKLVIAKP